MDAALAKRMTENRQGRIHFFSGHISVRMRS
jgi:hypothetical protein